jgi:hypothetical protein
MPAMVDRVRAVAIRRPAATRDRLRRRPQRLELAALRELAERLSLEPAHGVL